MLWKRKATVTHQKMLMGNQTAHHKLSKKLSYGFRAAQKGFIWYCWCQLLWIFWRTFVKNIGSKADSSINNLTISPVVLNIWEDDYQKNSKNIKGWKMIQQLQNT